MDRKNGLSESFTYTGSEITKYTVLISRRTLNFTILVSKSQALEQCRGGSRRVAKFLQESILIVFDFIWKVLLSDRNFANPLNPPLQW